MKRVLILFAAASAAAVGAAGLAQESRPPAGRDGVRVYGKIGDIPIDLTLRAPTAAPAAAPARVRPPLPEIKTPVLFDTPEADKILAAMQIFPPDNPWNEDISGLPVHPDSAKMLANMNPDRWLWYNLDMGFIIVPPDQKRVPVKLTGYPAESDPGPFPVPDNAPIEGWPLAGGTLDNIQRTGEGDRHCMLVDPVNGKLYEFFVMRRTNAGWQAEQSSTFDLKSNKLRPEGWTSADAAGLPIFPATVRYDELERGEVEHALRVTFRRTRRDYVYPATHFASRSEDTGLPRMGERLRLKADVDISGFSPNAQTVAKAMKKYGMFVADNGMDWLISVAPDKRITGLEDLKRLHGRDFEIVKTTGPNEGPRAR